MANEIFFGMLDQAGLNAHILYNSITENATLDRIQFLKQLSLQLSRPHLERRVPISGLNKNIHVNLKAILGIADETPTTYRVPNRKRCVSCPVKRQA